MKKVAIMQPYFLPYIGYFQLINAVDEFIIYDDVNYINKGWINRNNILVGNQASLFSIQLKEARQNKLIKEISLSDDQKWKAKLLKTIELNYKKAPNFSLIYPLLSEIILLDEVNLSAYIGNSLKKISNYLNITTKIIESSSVFDNQHLKAQARILDICKKSETQQYINPIGGVELYDKKSFESNDIKLNFIKTTPIEYAQFKLPFIPYLSVIDLLMFNSKEQINALLTQFELV